MRTRLSGATGAEHVGAVVAIAVLGVVGVGALGGALHGAIAGSARGTGSTGPRSHGGHPTVSTEAGAAGALRRLAELGHGDELAGAANDAARADALAEEAGGARAFTTDLRPAARALFGDHATKPVVKAWAELLGDASEGHAVLVSEFAKAAAVFLEPDHLATLLRRAQQGDLGAVDYAPLDVPVVRTALGRALAPFDSRKALTLLETLFAGDHRHLDVDARRELAEAVDTSVDALLRLAVDEDARVRMAVASRADLPEAVIRVLAEEDSEDILRLLASQPAAPPDLLDRLSASPDHRTQFHIASHGRAPASALERLVEQGDFEIASRIASNAATPPHVLATLEEVARRSEGPEAEGLLFHLAEHPSTPLEVIRRLAEEPSEDLRMAVSLNPSAPADLLARLALDPDEGTVRHVARHPSTPADTLRTLAASGGGTLLHALSENPSAPADVLWEVARRGSFGARLSLAQNASAPIDLLKALAGDDATYARHGIPLPEAGDSWSATTDADTLRQTRERASERLASSRNGGRAPADLADEGAAASAETDSLDSFGALGAPSTAPYFLRRLEAVTHALDGELPIRPRAVRAWDDLPAEDPRRPALAVAAEAARIDGARVEVDGRTLTVRVLRTPGALTANGNYMGNCVGDRCGRVNAGSHLIAALADESAPEKTLYNAGWNLDEPESDWYLGEVQGRFSEEVSSASLDRALHELTERLNGDAP